MGRSRRLNRERVVEAAAVLADECSNPDEVTLTALAASLGVRVPSLYNHIASLEDLRQAMAIYALQLLLRDARRAVTGLTGREAVLALARAYRQFAHQHPGIYPLTTRASAPEEEALGSLGAELVQLLLLLLASLGQEGDDALHTVRGFRALLHGFTSLERDGGYRMALDPDESFERLLATYLAGVAVLKNEKETLP